MENFVPDPNVPVPQPQVVNALPAPTDLFRQSWDIYLKRMQTFIVIMAVPILVSVILIPLLIGGGFLASAFGSPNILDDGIRGIIPLVLAGGLILLGVLLIQALAYGALLYAIKDSAEGIGIGESFSRSWRVFPSYVWMSILIVIIVIGGFFLLIIPGIIFSVWFSFAIYILISEGLTGMDALLKSKEYIRGYWGAVFGRFAFLTIVIGVFSGLIGFALGFLPYGEMVGNVISNAIFTPLSVIYIFLMYQSLRAIKGDVPFVPQPRQKTGFIVAGVIGIIVPIALVCLVIFGFRYMTMPRATDARRMAELQQVHTALEVYFADQGRYPASLGELSPKYLPEGSTSYESYTYQLQAGGEIYKLCAIINFKESCLTSGENNPVMGIE